MIDFEKTGLSGAPEEQVPPAKKELPIQEQLEEKEKVELCEGYGVVAYAELTDPYNQNEDLKEKVKKICERTGSAIEGSVKKGHLWISSYTNIQTETPVRNTREYIQAFRDFIEHQTERQKKQQEAGEFPRAAGWIGEARHALNGFGKTAMEAGDAEIAKEALGYTGYLQQFPDIAKQLDLTIEEIRKAKQERLEEEMKDHYQLSTNCGTVAYINLVDPYGKNEALQSKAENVYSQQGSGLKDSVKSGYLWFGSENLEASVKNMQDYIQALKKYLDRFRQQAEKTEPLSAEDRERITIKHNLSGIDFTPENWLYFAGSNTYNTREKYLELIERIKYTLEGFGETAKNAGDEKTYELVQGVLREAETPK